MGWKNCVVCSWSYNDAKGGCRNKACKNFDPNSVASKPVASTPFGKKSVGSKPLPIKPRGSGGTPKPPIQVSSNPVIIPKVVPDTPIVPWIESSPKQSEKPGPKGVPLKAETFTLICYRGEKSDWWPEPHAVCMSSSHGPRSP